MKKYIFKEIHILRNNGGKLPKPGFYNFIIVQIILQIQEALWMPNRINQRVQHPDTS